MADIPLRGDTVYFLSRQNTPLLENPETVRLAVYERLERGTFEVQTSSSRYVQVRRFPELDSAGHLAWLQVDRYA